MNPHEILPAPESAATSGEVVGSKEFQNEAEQATQVEKSPHNSAGGGALTAATVSGAQAHIAQVTQPTPVQPLSLSSMTADDVDLIEKEWVLRAKAIVAATIGDPHAQSQQLSKVKAEYIKKRYNRDIKVKEDN